MNDLMKLILISVFVSLTACAGIQKVETAEQATTLDGSALVVFSVESEDKFVIKRKRSSSCIVEPECTRRIESHYYMRDSSNILTEYFFDIRDKLHVVKISSGSAGDYYLKYAPPSLANRWVESTRLHFSVPAAGKIFYLGNIKLSTKDGQQLLDKKNRDIEKLFQIYPALKNQEVVDAKSWREEKDKVSNVNLVSCSGGSTVGMAGGTAGVTGYSSRCKYLSKRK